MRGVPEGSNGVKKMIDLGRGEAEYGSGFKTVNTSQVSIETRLCEDHSGLRVKKRRTPFVVGKTYQIFALEVKGNG